MRENNIALLKRWMEYFYLSFKDLGFNDAKHLEELEDDEIRSLMNDAEGDRGKHLAQGIFISEDWTITN